jgi:hypothetical protein
VKYFILFLFFLATQAQGEDGREGASFKEGSGIQLGSKTKESIGLELAEVEDRPAHNDIRITAQVYRESREASQNQGEPSGFAYASAWVAGSEADKHPAGLQLLIQGVETTTGSVVRVDQTMAGGGGRSEVLIQIQDSDRTWKIGDFAYASPPSTEGEPVTMIPVDAVLETAYGPFAYVVNGSFFLRTAITIGARHGDYIEITDGLYSGDTVVVRPVEALYLIELRATKGGGHSH